MLGTVFSSQPRPTASPDLPPSQYPSPELNADFVDSSSGTVITPVPASGHVVFVTEATPQTIELFQDASPQEPIVLRLKRSQKDGFRGTIYMLDARIDVTAAIRDLIDKHKLGSRVIYDSDKRQQHDANVRAHLENTHSQAPLSAPIRAHAIDLGRVVWSLARAGLSATRAALALRVTVSSLMAGVHIECKSLEELLEAEEAIRTAKANLEGYIYEIEQFDGTEKII
jgi:hypothetical protein